MQRWYSHPRAKGWLFCHAIPIHDVSLVTDISITLFLSVPVVTAQANLTRSNHVTPNVAVSNPFFLFSIKLINRIFPYFKTFQTF